jgi:hypothetical protein
MTNKKLIRIPITMTIQRGDGWRAYIEEMPSLTMLPIGTVRLEDDREGALVLDADRAVYVLVDNAGTHHDLDYISVRDALYGRAPSG